MAMLRQDNLQLVWYKTIKNDKRGIMSFQLRRYRGRPIHLDDYTLIMPGNLLLELHDMRYMRFSSLGFMKRSRRSGVI